MRPHPCCPASPSRPNSCFSCAAQFVEIGPMTAKTVARKRYSRSFFRKIGSGGFKTLPARLSLTRTLSPPGSKAGGREPIGDRRRVGKARSRNVRRAIGAAAIAVVGATAAWPQLCAAETMASALVQAYQNNPQLNAQRASARVTDEAVPQALSGYRPRISITGTAGEQYTDTVTKSFDEKTGTNVYTHAHGTTSPWTAGATATQTLFNGFQTANRTRAAESQVSAAREGLRVMEQTVLLAAATAYMDVLRDTANLEVQRTNVRVLEETLKQTRDRFNVGEVTRTDVAQAEAQLAAGQSAVAAAESVLNTSRANYRQVVGTERLNLDLVRNQARQAVVQAWGQLQAAKAQIAAAQSQVASSEVALNGVREEARVGQRTTLDVLNAQQALVNARVALVVAQHDRVVASYNVLAAVGRLSPQVLGLATSVYDPMVHYQQVRDAWYGIRIPDGR